ncbi:CoA transferase [Spiractinospora alimapuensis]|uniref:CaiB/BaiF CoA transferase family protein n=1 Tax=Spiractinospora alimapuensis TaxID=2820884 RepID=UPI001F31CB85|nr:CaiB/BaiF CoA-transferase family protein [Spiractinospora alimapuensis]QVQ53944.1 CoA transferase [Spiractinospora alimapuensis]
MGPLAGVRVIEMEGLAPAPFGCMMLADLGADVLQIRRESPGGVGAPPGPLDRNRRTVRLDLKHAEGPATVRRLVRSADVFVEGFRPGVAERLGVGPETLCEDHSRLIYARMTGWGQSGPLAPRAGHDINYIGLAGALEPIGRPGERPVPPLNLLGDFAGGGMLLVVGVLAALVERQRSGRGQVIDAAMVDGSALLTSFLHGMHAHGLWNGERGTNMLDGGAPFYDTYRTSDGQFMAVGCIEPRFFEEFARRLGIDDDPGNRSHLDPTRWSALREQVTAAFAQHTRARWTEIFADADACVTPVLSPWEAADHPHNQARSTYVEVDGVPQPAPAPRFARTPAPPPTPPNQGDPDLVQILAEWGLGRDEVHHLRDAGAIS